MRQVGETCPICGLAEGCRCHGELQAEREPILTLLPPLADEELEIEFTAEEGTPLLRELKTGVSETLPLPGEGRPLLREARGVERFIEEGRFEEADAALQRVLRFPKRVRRPWLRYGIVLLVVTLLLWYLIRALAAGYTSGQN